MQRAAAFLIGILSLGAAADADDKRGLHWSGKPTEVTISGVSSGAAMAVQYAVAHSQTIAGVGSIAGPAWGCANGSLSQAVNRCMCGRETVQPTIGLARRLALSGRIDALASGTPQALRRSYVFQSAADQTVKKESAEANIVFLSEFIGNSPIVDWGNAADHSSEAGHGIIAPEIGNEACALTGDEVTFIRRCGAEDNAGKTLHALYDPGSAFDPGKRANDIPETEVWPFDQQQLINQIKDEDVVVSPDDFLLWLPVPSLPYSTDRRKNFDMAATGYIYVPPVCRGPESRCRVHIALHGCKQDARTFAVRSGYNNWAEHYRTIIVYPALAAGHPGSEAICQMPRAAEVVDLSLIEPNPNGCWDWWGYLDTFARKGRYLTRQGPQVRVIERIIAEVTKTP